MSGRKRKNFGLSEQANDQGSRPNSAHASGRSTPNPYYSSQPTVDPRFGDQSIPGPSYSGQATPYPQPTDPYGGRHFPVPQIAPYPWFGSQAAPDQQRITGPYLSQPILEATFGGHPGPYSSQPTVNPHFGDQSSTDPSYSRQPTFNQQRITDPYPGDQSILEHTSSGQRPPFPLLSSEPTVDRYFGDQPMLDPSSNDEPTPKRRRIAPDLYSGGQSILDPTSSGQRTTIPRSSMSVPRSSGQTTTNQHFDLQFTPAPRSIHERTRNLPGTTSPYHGGQRIPASSSSDRSTPVPRSSSQPSARQHLGVQPTPRPRTGGQYPPNQQRVTDWYGGQPLPQATFGGHPGPYSSIQLTPEPRSGQRIPDPPSSDQGVQRTPDPVTSGQSNPASRSSRQPTFNPHFGNQPTPAPRASHEPTPEGRSITGLYSGGQPTVDPNSSQSGPVSGQPINDGIYTITNVRHCRFVYLENPNDTTPLRGHFKPGNRNAQWHVKSWGEEEYSIQNVEHDRYAFCGPFARLKDSVEGHSTEKLWRIRALPSGEYTIATTDTGYLWMLPYGEPGTPVELFNVHTDRTCWWTFTKLANAGYAETSTISETLEAPQERLQGNADTATLGQRQISHPPVDKDMRDELEKEREDSGHATKSTRDSDFRILERLKPVDAPSYRDDRGCMEGTRTTLLDHLVAWTLEPKESLTNGSNAANMYWLYGSPGLGKTSIANSLCDRLHGSRTLGGSFFCRRDDPVMREPRRILPTLISKLAEMWGPYQKLVIQALRDDPQLTPESKRGEMLFSLVQSVQTPPPHALVLVVDALDECGDPDTRRSLLTCLFEGSSRVSWIKLVITSRQEHDIKIFFDQNHVSSRDLAYDDQTLDDIRLFTRQRMSTIARSHYLPTDWPGEERLQQIINRSGGLFIYVETVSRYVDDPDPDPLLDEVLDGELVAVNAELHKLYSMAILSRIGKSKEKFRSFAQAVVVVATYRPLPEETLGSLVGLKPSLVRSWVERLSSILYRDASTNGGIRVRHLSVIDFLTSPACPEEFRVVLGQANEEIGMHCLTTMAKELKFNICELETSCFFNAAIPDLGDRVQGKISDALQYSSMHWSSHLCSDSAPASIAVSEKLDAFLSGTQPLYWVEVMSLMGKVPVAVSSMRRMKACFKKFEDRHRELVEDALRFLLAFFAPISTSTPHIYISALPFTPVESDISKHARVSFPEMIDVCKGRADSWPAPSSIWLGHTNFVWGVAYSPDGLNVVSGSSDNTIRIWDAQTGAAVGQPLTGHTGWVYSVAYSPDGLNVVSGSYDNTIRIWDAQTGAAVGQPLTGHTGWVYSVAYSPDGLNVVSGSSDNTIRIWDAQTGAAVGQPLTGHTGWVYSVGYSPDGLNVVSGSFDNTIRIWDAQTGAAVGQPLTGHTGWINSVAYSPDGLNVVSGSQDNTIRIWDAQTGAAVGQPLTGHTRSINSVAYSPDGRNVVSGSFDNTIRIWDAQTGAAVGQPLTGHTGWVYSVAYSPDGLNVVSGSFDNTIRIWDAQTGAAVGQPLTGHTGEVYSVAYSPDGLNVVSGSQDNTIRIWDAQTGAAVGQPLTGHTQSVCSVAYSPDGLNVVSGSFDNTIRIWDAQTGAAVGQPLTGHTGWVNSVAYSPDGLNVVSGSRDNTIRIWDAQTGAAVGQPLTGHTGWVYSVAYSPDGLHVVSGSFDNTIRIWDAQTGAAVGQPLTGHTKGINSVAYSPDGLNVVSGSQDNTIRIWDAQTGAAVGQPLTGHTRSINSVAYSPDGLNVVSGSSDNTIRIWDAQTGAAVSQPLTGHAEEVWSVAYSPDGQNVASGSSAHTIRIWDAQAGMDEDQHSVVSHSRITSTDDLPLTTFSGCAIPLNRLDPDGWVRGAEGLLFWVPEDSRNGLTCPAIMTIPNTGRQRPVRIDFSRFQYGTSWTNIRGGIQGADYSSISSV